jgi:cytidine deaminase
MPKINKLALVRSALKAQERAVAPYSHFRVGAALLAPDGQIILGANVESASYGLTCCAERVALFKALTEGVKNFLAIAVVTDPLEPGTPCGACRQLLSEYAPQAKVFLASSQRLDHIQEYSVGELLPYSFTLKAPK